jgi:hypothetical protein
MLPLFGKVLPWQMTTDQIVAIRPPAPPLRGSAEMDTEIEEVKYYSDNLPASAWLLYTKWADGAGTYTPPDIGTILLRSIFAITNFSEVKAARAFAHINTGTAKCSKLRCWDTRVFLFQRSATQLNPSIKTGTGIPNFPAYVSGHSTFQLAQQELLSYLFRSIPAN